MCCLTSPLSSAGLVAVAIAEGRLWCPDLWSLQKDNEPHASPNEWRGRPRFSLFPHNELPSFNKKPRGFLISSQYQLILQEISTVKKQSSNIQRAFSMIMHTSA